MPLHLLGKKSWNVYNSENVARVKADEAAAVAREAEDDHRMQEIDAQRRTAILRGTTPPPLPESDDYNRDEGNRKPTKSGPGHDRKRRRLAGETDTDRDIRLAKAATTPGDEDDNVATLKLRKPDNDAPLTDHAGHISLFPADEKAALKQQKNAEAEAEKKKKERELEDQYTMRFSNAAGRSGLEDPWYAASKSKRQSDVENSSQNKQNYLEYPGFENKNVWGREDPARRQRQRARITTNDPLAVMEQAYKQMDRVQRDKEVWEDERKRELLELRAAQERDDRRERHGKRKRYLDERDEERHSRDSVRKHEKPYGTHKSTRHRDHRSRSRQGRHEHSSSHRHDLRRSRSRERSRERRSHTHHHSRSRHKESRRQPDGVAFL